VARQWLVFLGTSPVTRDAPFLATISSPGRSHVVLLRVVSHNMRGGCLLNRYHHHPPVGKTCPPPQNTGVWPRSPAKFVSLTLGRCTTPSQLAHLRPATPLPSFQSLSWTILPPTPFNWSWTTKSGPNQGKLFCIPCIPTSYQKSNHRVVRWTVDLCHSFKAHLSPRVLKDGRVPTPLVHIYQSNMLIHFRHQLTTTRAPPQPSLSATPAPRKSADSHAQPSPACAPLCPPKNPNTPTELNKLHAEVSHLRKQLAALTLPQASPSSPISISPLHPPPKGHQSSPPPLSSSPPPRTTHCYRPTLMFPDCSPFVLIF
jgi:hypothetical protein